MKLLTLILVIGLQFLSTNSIYASGFSDTTSLHIDKRCCDFVGSTTIYDYSKKQWLFTDSIDAHRATLPASTFKVLNSLIALETGSVEHINDTVLWDGTAHQLFGKPYPVWNKDTDLNTAFKNSTIWFYVEMAKRVGKKKYKEIIQEIGYGNGDLSEKGLDFWNYGAFAVSPKDQIDFLVRLYEGDLPFSNETMEAVKQVMISEDESGQVFRDKTGWAQKEGKDIGWWVGYVTKEENVYFFATRITKEIADNNPDFAACRKSITKGILATVIR